MKNETNGFFEKELSREIMSTVAGSGGEGVEPVDPKSPDTGGEGGAARRRATRGTGER